jgi:hypothetical protein
MVLMNSINPIVGVPHRPIEKRDLVILSALDQVRGERQVHVVLVFRIVVANKA